MYCTNCGKEIKSTENFCGECGFPVRGYQPAQYREEQRADVQPANTDSGPWAAFAILGFILGLISICLCWTGPVGLLFALNALPFAIMGRKSTQRRGKALAGIILSSIAMGLAFLITLVSLPEIINALN